MKTALITSDSYKNHNTGDGHPEKIDRVTAVIDNFKKLDNKNLVWKKPSNFEQSILIKTHTKNYIKQVNLSFPQSGLKFLDGDTVVSPGSKDATKDAVGSIISAIEGVEKKEFKKVNSFENLENTLLKVGGRVGNLMDVVQEAMGPESPLGKDLSKKEKDLISKSIIELEEKIAKLKMSIK